MDTSPATTQQLEHRASIFTDGKFWMEICSQALHRWPVHEQKPNTLGLCYVHRLQVVDLTRLPDAWQF